MKQLQEAIDAGYDIHLGKLESGHIKCFLVQGDTYLDGQGDTIDDAVVRAIYGPHVQVESSLYCAADSPRGSKLMEAAEQVCDKLVVTHAAGSRSGIVFGFRLCFSPEVSNEEIVAACKRLDDISDKFKVMRIVL